MAAFGERFKNGRFWVATNVYFEPIAIATNPYVDGFSP